MILTLVLLFIVIILIYMEIFVNYVYTYRLGDSLIRRSRTLGGTFGLHHTRVRITRAI